jgi:Ammonia permease
LAFLVFFPIWFFVFPYYYAGVLQGGYYPTGQGVEEPMYIYAFFLGAFGAVTLALIFAGAPERLKFGGWLAFAVFFSAVQWPLVSSWIWGNGFLYNLGQYFGLPGYGVRDFAGGTVVHAYGAWRAPWPPGCWGFPWPRGPRQTGRTWPRRIRRRRSTAGRSSPTRL